MVSEVGVGVFGTRVGATVDFGGGKGVGVAAGGTSVAVCKAAITAADTVAGMSGVGAAVSVG